MNKKLMNLLRDTELSAALHEVWSSNGGTRANIYAAVASTEWDIAKGLREALDMPAMTADEKTRLNRAAKREAKKN